MACECLGPGFLGAGEVSGQAGRLVMRKFMR